MIRWCMTCLGTARPSASVTSTRNPRNQPSTGHSNVWSGVSCDMPRSIMAWPSMGGMFGRLNGPLVMVSSWWEESMPTETRGSVGPPDIPTAMVEARIELHNMSATPEEATSSYCAAHSGAAIMGQPSPVDLCGGCAENPEAQTQCQALVGPPP